MSHYTQMESVVSEVQAASSMALLELVITHPFYLTDHYYLPIGDAIRERYAELTKPQSSYADFAAGSLGII